MNTLSDQRLPKGSAQHQSLQKTCLRWTVTVSQSTWRWGYPAGALLIAFKAGITESCAVLSVLVSHKGHVFSSNAHLDTTYSTFRYHLWDVGKMLLQQNVETLISECTTAMGHTWKVEPGIPGGLQGWCPCVNVLLWDHPVQLEGWMPPVSPLHPKWNLSPALLPSMPSILLTLRARLPYPNFLAGMDVGSWATNPLESCWSQARSNNLTAREWLLGPPSPQHSPSLLPFLPLLSPNQKTFLQFPQAYKKTARDLSHNQRCCWLFYFRHRSALYCSPLLKYRGSKSSCLGLPVFFSLIKSLKNESRRKIVSL